VRSVVLSIADGKHAPESSRGPNTGPAPEMPARKENSSEAGIHQKWNSLNRLTAPSGML
jgi:hypothetical protein